MHTNTNLLIKFRERKNFSQEQMAKMLGYKSKGSYSLIESGKTKVHINLANKITQILELTSEEVLALFFNK
ncbi:MAG: helix-turn-helix transcriptional regulator [Clostridium beijerinckii]|jgi:DNA-binding XRE family transcriptional regulator|nr:helix-turn-helix transcriptional regulator [Clostridium beijerinckii]MCI1582059.1 helix-turn-helix transcriptional regulator [Clostridium beijerinckii]MCI1621909.1 helix-turn-helix transcriptional regulator [Clostridium beijerinckii]